MSLSVSAVGGYNTFYPIYNASPISPVKQANPVSRGSEGISDVDSGKKVEKGECQTCKNRKYVDGSNENNVSFKSPSHIDPNTSASQVMAHEQEHVSNAIAEGNEKNKELVSASVTLHTSVCPECGRVYVSGGTTHTSIQTTKPSSNPYEQNQQKMNRNFLAGMNFDMSA